MIDWTYKATPGDIIMGNKPSKRVYPSDIIFGISNNPKVPTVEKEAKVNTGANRGAVGSLGQSSTAGLAGNSQAGLVGSVNTEVQNDDMMLPYTKI